MVDLFSFKELEPCYLKATYPIEIGDRKIEKGEIIASFDKIQMGFMKEIKDFVAARGGFDNRGWVFWETTKELPINFSQGVFSSSQLALLTNSKMIDIPETITVPISNIESLESNENGEFSLKEKPTSLFIYNKKNGEKNNKNKFILISQFRKNSIL